MYPTTPPLARWLSSVLLCAAVAAPVRHGQATVRSGSGALPAALPRPAPTPHGTVYNGWGCNPVTFQNGHGPFVGEYWSSQVAVAPGQVSVLLLGAGPAPAGWKPGGIFGTGELLVLPPMLRLDVSGSGRHFVRIPLDGSLVGQEFCVQAALCRPKARGIGRLAGGLRALELQNALILRILPPPPCGEFTCGG
ncbi:MAG TPA: hypothetical protein VF414_19525 [Thermoanaerobaculia bacterium]